MAMNAHVGKWAYGLTFTVLLPLLLAVWSVRLDALGLGLWPIPWPAALGLAPLAAGVAMMAWAMAALWRLGGGLPMNAYPPPRYVTAAAYAWFDHPIYVGFVLAAVGAAILAGSPAGLWLVAPLLALAASALVLGYEGPALRRRFGPRTGRAPWFGLPGAGQAMTPARRLAVALLALAPWAVLYTAFAAMPEPPGAVDPRFAWEFGLPHPAWSVWLYSAAYPMVLAAALQADTGDQARRFVLAAWLATATGFAAMLLFPCRADFLVPHAEGVTAWLLAANREVDADWLACPSFHAVWVTLAHLSGVARRRRWRWPSGLASAAILLSCLATGAHAVADVLAGVGLGAACWWHGRLWRALVRGAERLANGWSAFQVGPVRVINHALWSALAALAGMLVVATLAGPEALVPAGAVFAAGLVAAGAWGYGLEGGGRLARPFGYYGFLLGGLAALAAFGWLSGGAPHRLAAAFAVAAPLAQALGRVRCLVQGCCHGRPVVGAPGMRVHHPVSRVVALAGLDGVAIHPTQLYSLVAGLAVFLVLWRLAALGAPSTLVAGLYLILASLARFVEEGYRGEPQTRRVAGLAVYQWLALAFCLAGAVLTGVPGVAMPAPAAPGPAAWGLALGAGVLAALAMSVDLPRANWPLSRLTVSPGRKG